MAAKWSKLDFTNDWALNMPEKCPKRDFPWESTLKIWIQLQQQKEAPKYTIKYGGLGKALISIQEITYNFLQ